MYDHIGLKVRDVRASARFYQAALAPLGHVLASQDETGAGFGPAGAPALWLYRVANTGSGTHVAFAAADRAAVDRFHAEGLKACGRNNGGAGLRADYGPNYYASTSAYRKQPCHQGVTSANTIKQTGTVIISMGYNLDAGNTGGNICATTTNNSSFQITAQSPESPSITAEAWIRVSRSGTAASMKTTSRGAPA